jgi:ribose 5-phosphate isomerase A
MSQIEPAKVQAAAAAAALVENGMAVGLGSGTTASLIVRSLGQRMQTEGLRIVGVATSAATAELATAVGIPLKDLDEIDVLDLNLDGADEIDRQFQMIKGRGGALLREKIVAMAAKRRVTVLTAEKRVDQLGLRMPIPVEVSRFGLRHTEGHLREFGAATTFRVRADGQPYITDGGNTIIDCRFAQIDDVAALARGLKSIAGVFETGLFLGLCDLLIAGYPDRVERIESRQRSAPLSRGTNSAAAEPA